MQSSKTMPRVKCAIIDFLLENLEYKRRVYEKSLQLAKLPLPNNYEGRLQYEQDELCKLLDSMVGDQGVWVKKMLVNEENIHLHWHLVEELIFPESRLTWMEYIFGPIFPLFRNQELNEFIMEFNGEDRETIIRIFTSNSEELCYKWMYWYKDVQAHPEEYEDYTFPRLPRKLPLCLGHLRGCNNRSHHFCEQCVQYFNTVYVSIVPLENALPCM